MKEISSSTINDLVGRKDLHFYKNDIKGNLKCEILHSELYNKGYEYYDIGPEEYFIPAIEIFYDGNLYEGELADGQWELKEVSVLKPIGKLIC